MAHDPSSSPKFLTPEKSATRKHDRQAKLMLPVSGIPETWGGELGSRATTGLSKTRSTDFFGFDEFVEERCGVLVELAVELRLLWSGRHGLHGCQGGRRLQRTAAGRADSRHRRQQHVTNVRCLQVRRYHRRKKSSR